MKGRRRDGGGPLARRGILKAIALAPVALAACASAAKAQRSDAPAATGSGAAGPAPRRAGADTDLAAVRGAAIPPSTEPAFVFRAAAFRPGEPR